MRRALPSAKLLKNSRELANIQVKYHFIRQLVKDGEIKLSYCPTKDQLADVSTKGTTGPTLKDLCSRLGLVHHIQHGRELECRDIVDIADGQDIVDIVYDGPKNQYTFQEIPILRRYCN